MPFVTATTLSPRCFWLTALCVTSRSSFVALAPLAISR
jgi:hypothetical protein